MLRKTYLWLIVMALVLCLNLWITRRVSAGSVAFVLDVQPTPMQQSPGPTVTASTRPIAITVTMNATTPTGLPAEATIIDTYYKLRATVAPANSGVSLKLSGTASEGQGTALERRFLPFSSNQHSPSPAYFQRPGITLFHSLEELVLWMTWGMTTTRRLPEKSILRWVRPAIPSW